MGGNQGRVNEVLELAICKIASRLGRVITRSSIYSTKAWGPVTQPDFLNVAVVIETIFPPRFLLRQLLAIEKESGRKREVKYGPRTLDIDMLFYGQQILNYPDLKLPHPEIQGRRFALVPLLEIGPNRQHPVLQKTIQQLLEICPDTLDVKLWP